MSNITDVIEFLIKQGRKDLAQVVVEELKGNTTVRQAPLSPIHKLTSPMTDPPYRITS